MSDELDTTSNGRLRNILECMLFVSPQPLVVRQVAESLETDEAEIEKAIHQLRLDYQGGGLQIIRIAGGYQMCTRPEYGDDIAKLLTPERVRLSKAALETVAIIAYRQPVTAPEIDAIRGVNSDGVLHTLMDRGLVKQVGRRETVGRPILYATTEEFLNHFGLNDLADLPDLEDVEIPEPGRAEAAVSAPPTEAAGEDEA